MQQSIVWDTTRGQQQGQLGRDAARQEELRWPQQHRSGITCGVLLGHEGFGRGDSCRSR